MLALLRRLLAQKGTLSAILIDEADGMPSSSAYIFRFKGLLRAYQLIGYTPQRDHKYLEINRRLRDYHSTQFAEIVNELKSAGADVRTDPATELLTINEEFTASLVLARCREIRTGIFRWLLRLDTSLAPDITIAARMQPGNQAILAAGLQVTLQTAVVNGLNADQVGPLVQFAVERGLFGVLFQPIMFAGRDREVTDEVRHARRYTLSHLAHDLVRSSGWDWQPLRDWIPTSAFALFGYLADRLLGSHTSLVCTATPSSGVASPLLVHAKTGTVVPLGSFVNIEGFLDDLCRIIDQNVGGFDLIAAVQTAMDVRFDSAAAPANFTHSDLYQILEQCVARVNSSIDGWSQRGYERGEWRLLIVMGMWFQDLFNFDLRSIEASTTMVATQDGEISFCAYNAGGWREAVERTHRTATLSEWHQQHGRHSIFAGNHLVPISELVSSQSGGRTPVKS